MIQLAGNQQRSSCRRIGFKISRSPRQPGKMAFYQDASGVDPQIEQIKAEVLKAGGAQSFSMNVKDQKPLDEGMADNWAYSNKGSQRQNK
jgi:hypothetical protein